MSAPDGPSSDDEALRAHAEALTEVVGSVVAAWVVRCVHERLPGDLAEEQRSQALRAAATAGEQARRQVESELRELLSADVDEQATTPLQVLRRAVAHPTGVLRGIGAPPVERDGFAVRAFPDDVYELSPATLADVDPALHEPGLVWGAAKAHVVLSRRRGGGGGPVSPPAT